MCEENKQAKRHRDCHSGSLGKVGTEKREGELFFLCKLVRKGLNGKAVFEQRSKGRDVSCNDIISAP